MKKRTAALLLTALMLLTLALAGCGSAAGATASGDASSSYYAEQPAAAAESADSYDALSSTKTAGIAADASGNTAVGTGNTDSAETTMQADKIIYNADAQVETTDYDATVRAVNDLVKKYNGFLESSSVSGRDYYDTASGSKSYRTASFTLRIPAESFQTLVNSLSELGNVPYCNISSQNVTADYYDVQSRLAAYQTQETRLLDMLKVAETVEDMLAIQQQLTEVQYQIDSLQSTLTNYDRQVYYSTVTLQVREVEKYTKEPVVTENYWEKMSQGFVSTLKSVGEFFQDLFLWIVTNLPVLAVVAVVLFALIRLIVRLRRRRTESGRPSRRERRAERRARRQAKKAGAVQPEAPKSEK